MNRFYCAMLVSGILVGLTACGASHGYEGAFAETSKIQGNLHAFSASRDQAFRAVTGTLVEQGFNIDQADGPAGLIKATRNFADPKQPEINYHITATAFVTEAAPTGSTVTFSASQHVRASRGH